MISFVHFAKWHTNPPKGGFCLCYTFSIMKFQSTVVALLVVSILLNVVAIGLVYYFHEAPNSEVQVVVDTLDQDLEERANDMDESLPKSKLYPCSGNENSSLGQSTRDICYTVEEGDTLWEIAEEYYGSGFRWNELYDGQRDGVAVNRGKPNQFETSETEISAGDVIGMTVGDMYSEMYPSSNGYFARSLTISPYNDDRIVLLHFYGTSTQGYYPELSGNSRDYIAPEHDALMLNGQRYGNDYRTISHLQFSKNGKHISFVGREMGGTCYVVVDENEHEFPCANDITDPVYNSNYEHFLVRVNRDNSYSNTTEAFSVITDQGNGPYFDYVDSLVWIDEDNFAYRAKQGEDWMVVVNHEPQQLHPYVDFLVVENGRLNYSSENGKAGWQDHTILMSSEINSLSDQRNATRKADIQTILSALYSYGIDKGGFSSLNIPVDESCDISSPMICDLTQSTADGSPFCSQHETDLRELVLEDYLFELPSDPSTDRSWRSGTGYSIVQNGKGTITICAPYADDEESISVSR